MHFSYSTLPFHRRVTARLLLILGLCCLGAGCQSEEASGEAPIDAGADTTSAQACGVDTDCDDGNPCTEANCAEDGTCRSTLLPGTSCDTGDPCRTGATCTDEGVCAGGSPFEDDGNSCTTCTCDSETGPVCVPTEIGSACSDGNCCTANDTCQPCDPATDTGCTESAISCLGQTEVCGDDGDPCTDSACACDESGNATCTTPAAEDGTLCDYSPNDCTAGDQCQGGQCIVGDPLPLDDNNPCTKDTCVKGQIEHVPDVDGQCDDDNECTTEDSCYLGTCVGGPPVECALPACGSSAACEQGVGCVVEWKPAGASCEDGNDCTTAESCDENHECVGGEPASCTDNNPCTTDSCAPEQGCVNTPSAAQNGTVCAAANACASIGTCQDGLCEAVEEPDCSDGNPCTTDSCDPDSGCIHSPLDASCDDGDPCTNGDSCQEGSCLPGTGLGGATISCNQQNSVDDDGCCCFAVDPTGAHKSGHVLDMGQTPENTSLECCIKPGFNVGCNDTAYIDVSEDGVSWSAVTSFPTTSTKDANGGWENVCVTITPDVAFQYVRGANEECYVDHFKCTLPCDNEGCGNNDENCDDGNPCTTDSCDIETNTCTNAPFESATCLLVQDGNNLISFQRLPVDPTLANVLGLLEPYTDWLFTEAKMARRLDSGEWLGNLTHIERTRGYWLHLSLPPGQSPMALPLTGDATDPDLTYVLHTGVNSISFPAAVATPVADALSDDDQPLFQALVGQGIAAFAQDDGFIGSLTHFQTNHGYEVLVDAVLPAFQFDCADCDGVDPYSYGCTDPAASNFSADAEIDNNACEYALPEGWQIPDWNGQKNQAFVVFFDLHVGGAPLEDGDAVAAVIEGEVHGFGTPVNGRTTVPMINGENGQSITFEIYDASAGTTTPLTFTEGLTWGLNAFTLAGCTDPQAPNYAALAAVSIDNCQ